MKMFLIVYCEASDEDVVAKFKNAGFKSYTKMQGAMGEGEGSEPKLGTHYWPGRNNTLFFAVPDEELPKLHELFRELKAEHPRAGLKAFTFPLEECV
ncbi:MAG TPA: hypothetical protein PKZ12_00765 [Smithellaceae bacterium]|nr:hypothetical protein [Smithellaceae bacterium]